jgi:hypothetical protein
VLILKEIEPRDPNCLPRERKVGGNRRRRSWTICPACLTIFVMPRLGRRFCCYACKVKAQTTGRRTVRRTITKARSAQSLLRYHVQAGNLNRPDTCEECGATGSRIEGAHFNYDEPLRVRWLCRSCHVRWDKHQPKGGTIRLAMDSLLANGAGKEHLTSTITETTPAVAGAGSPAEKA